MKLTEQDIKTLENNGRLEIFFKKSAFAGAVSDLIDYQSNRKTKTAKIVNIYLRPNGNVYVLKPVSES
jgi:hypothetical protein